MGDKNSKWFHSKASERRKRNTIENLIDGGGNRVTDEEEIGQLATNYFKSLFQSTSRSLKPLTKFWRAFIKKFQKRKKK